MSTVADSPTPDVSLREKAERATRGPWKRDRNWHVTAEGHEWSKVWLAAGVTPENYDKQYDRRVCHIYGPSAGNNASADLEYIVACSPEILIALLDERDSLRSRVERAEADSKATEPTRYTQVPDGCWVACIAGLTDIPHEELAVLVPIHEGKFDGSMGTEYRNAVNALLRSRGWRLESVGPDVPRGYAVGAGTSPRGLFHAIIVKDGAMWHDPHPSREGVVSLESYEVVIPIHPVAGAIEQFARWRDALAPTPEAPNAL